jgi:hypothetical protein
MAKDDDDDPLCRCGKPAPLDVSITAGPPFGMSGRRTELSLTTVACRDCAFAAGKLMLEFLDGKKGTCN